MRSIPIISAMLFQLYRLPSRILRNCIRYAAWKLEGGDLYSQTLRRIFREHYGVEIGLYTHGHCFSPGTMDRGTSIGRYCSVAYGARALNHNHPMEFKSTHAFFFNHNLGHCADGLETWNPLSIGNDVWLGTNCLILPHVRRIGDGAVVAAGAVVNKDVPPYAVVAGNPARVVRFRFAPDIIEKLLKSRWWEKPIEALDINEFSRPLHEEPDTDTAGVC
ncbi:MAG TPA: CatB-related O-acetyltransferase [Verrucomicrobiae bacterium]|nr:CatB-related O-acetyltransferase [Verrucomicrobiae bacterium]